MSRMNHVATLATQGRRSTSALVRIDRHGAEASERSVPETDEQLVVRWQAGQAEAGTVLLQRYENILMRYFRSRSAAAPEDLVQQTWLVCLQNIRRLRDPSKFGAFLLGVARNISLEQHRKRKANTHGELDREPKDQSDTPSRVASLREERSQLLSALKSLAPECEMAVVLHYWSGLSVAEIARMQGVAEGTIKARLARSRQQLKRRLGALFARQPPLMPPKY